jgi:hypothetical protein
MSQNSPRPKKSRLGKSDVKSMPIIFFNIKGIVHKEFILAGQPVNSEYYCDVLRRLHENVQSFRPELWRQKNCLLQHDNAPSHTSFSTREFLTRNNMTAIPYPPYFSLSPTEDKTERPPF